jgi:ankyrin repeat protein
MSNVPSPEQAKPTLKSFKPADIKQFVEQGGDPNLILAKAETEKYEDMVLLDKAWLLGDGDLVKFLIGKGADPNPLTRAKHPDLKEKLGEDRDMRFKRTLLSRSLANQYKTKIAEELLKGGADPNIPDPVDGNVPLIYAIQENHELIDLLLEKGANVNAKDRKGNTPLIAAVNYKKYDLIQKLVEKGADVNIKIGDHTILDILFDDTDTEDYNKSFVVTLKLILQKFEGELTNIDGIFYAAAKRDDVDIVKFLLDKGVDLRGKIPDGYNQVTFLMSALHRKSNNIIKFLLELVTNLDEPNVFGQTALNYAISIGNVEVVDILLKKGASLDMKDTKGNYWVPKSVGQAIKNNYSKEIIGQLVKLLFPEIKKRGNEELANEFAKYRTLLGYYLYQYLPNEEVELTNMLIDYLPKWKGISRRDAEKWGGISSKKVSARLSACPFCLHYSLWGEDCKYMKHECDPTSRHERLYQVYKNNEGLVSWCSVCGRPCTGHRHHVLSNGSEFKPVGFAKTQADYDLFSEDCIPEGGGGGREKVNRLTALLIKAKELQAKKNIIHYQSAINQLVEAAWVHETEVIVPAGFDEEEETPAKPTVIVDIERNKADVGNFPEVVKNNDYCVIIGEKHGDNRHVFKLKHTDSKGVLQKHSNSQSICYEDLMDGLFRNFPEQHGKCLFCTAIIHPDEVKIMLDNLGREPTSEETDKFKKYKVMYNEHYQPKTGGGEEDEGKVFFMTEEDEAKTKLQCEIAFKKKGGRNKSFKKTLIKRRKTYRRNLKRTRKNK